MVIIKVNDRVFQKKRVENDPKIPRLLPLDGFATIGDADFKLPPP
ncbi:hypothetical protein [Commensalibacter oyaizuii]|uniref:Uncharacterized protein n=1 Tax=Commensalibacter oyaizuii TaxID=3043873 RepID=A0ABT6Q2C3_9PROT|nr:hypothetical protein [Commensalibacter sp. TBRC 16381]MDI2091281.1 hypothetical protein [Commensalibacter sp. TBRC 16381]